MQNLCSWKLLSLFCVLPACSGQGAAPAKKTEPAASAPASVAAKPAAPVAVPASAPVVDGAPYGDQWLVILSSSKELGKIPEGQQILETKPELGAKVVRLSSTQFKGLMPCYEIVVAKAFADRKEAAAYSAKLRELGVDNYAKNAGKFIGEQPEVEAYCREEREPEATSCGALRWVTDRPGQTWMEIEVDALVLERATASAPPERPLDPGYESWAAPLTAKTLGPYTVGQKYKLYDASSGNAASCSIKGFVSGTLGTPHFGYLQQAQEEGKPPTAPGCGEAKLYAELDCGGAKGDFALLETEKAPVIYVDQGEQTRDTKALVAVRKALEASEEYKTKLADATAEAKAKGQPLQTIISLQAFRRPDRGVFVMKITLQTGEGYIECGGEDLREELVGVVEQAPGGVGKVLFPLQSIDYAEIDAVLDLEGDGALELLQTGFIDSRSIHRLDGSEACETSIPFCDCGC
jgi:hypothetical protein